MKTIIWHAEGAHCLQQWLGLGLTVQGKFAWLSVFHVNADGCCKLTSIFPMH